MDSKDPTWWQALLAASSPLWNLLSALLGGLIAAVTAWRLERSRAARERLRDHLTLKRKAYLDFLSRIEIVGATTYGAQLAAQLHEPDYMQRYEAEVEAWRAFRASQLEVALYAPPKVVEQASRVYDALQAQRAPDLPIALRESLFAAFDVEHERTREVMRQDLAVGSLSW